MRKHLIAERQPGSCEQCGRIVLRDVRVCRETVTVNDWPTSIPHLYCSPEHCPYCSDSTGGKTPLPEKHNRGKLLVDA